MFSRGSSDGKHSDASPPPLAGSPKQKVQKTENSHPNSLGDFPVHEDGKDAPDNSPDDNPILAAISRAAKEAALAAEANQSVIQATAAEQNDRIKKLGESLSKLRADLKQ